MHESSSTAFEKWKIEHCSFFGGAMLEPLPALLLPHGPGDSHCMLISTQRHASAIPAAA
jgi:hypothetical protein